MGYTPSSPSRRAGRGLTPRHISVALSHVLTSILTARQSSSSELDLCHAGLSLLGYPYNAPAADPFLHGHRKHVPGIHVSFLSFLYAMLCTRNIRPHTISPSTTLSPPISSPPLPSSFSFHINTYFRMVGRPSETMPKLQAAKTSSLPSFSFPTIQVPQPPFVWK